MAFQVKPGQVFRPKAFQAHAHVLLSPPNERGLVLAVNWTTFKEECVDEACFLDPGDHPALRHRSTIAYSRAHLWQVEKIVAAVANGVLEELEPLSPATLTRLIAGARQSKELRREWKRMLPPE
jgi:hypothetical protein